MLYVRPRTTEKEITSQSYNDEEAVRDEIEYKAQLFAFLWGEPVSFSRNNNPLPFALPSLPT